MKSGMPDALNYTPFVAPFAGAWIEIGKHSAAVNLRMVAPFAGAWIEIVKRQKAACVISVAPFAGAWIEIPLFDQISGLHSVAPFAGAWIEITNLCYFNLDILSLPSRERGLKWLNSNRILQPDRRSLRGSVD